MGFNSQPIEITAKYLLELLGESRIFERYLGFSIDYDAYFSANAYRADNNATCRFYWNGYKTKFTDKAIGLNEDCFGIVMKKYHCSFGTALRIIAKDFGIKNGQESPLVDINLVKVVKDTYKEGETLIKIKERGFWTKRDVDYWLLHGIDSKILNKFDVVSISGAIITTRKGETRLAFSHIDLAFAYKEFNNNKYYYKIYQPEKSVINGKWLSNIPRRYYHGFKQLEEFTDIIIVTKSLKDIMVLNRFKISAISPQSESSIISYNGFQLIKNKCKCLYSLFDYDLAGIKCAKRHKKLYGIEPLFIIDGSKDISGYVKKNGIKKTKELIENTKTIIKL